MLAFLQPIEFTQIDHEGRFKFVLKGIFILITVCVVLLFVIAQIIEPGFPFSGMTFLTGEMWDELEVGKLKFVSLLFRNAVTALTMVTAEIFTQSLDAIDVSH